MLAHSTDLTIKRSRSPLDQRIELTLFDGLRSTSEVIKACEKFFNILFDVDAVTSNKIENTFLKKKRFVNGIVYKNSFETMYSIFRSSDRDY